MREARDHGPEPLAAVAAPGEAGGMAFGVAGAGSSGPPRIKPHCCWNSGIAVTYNFLEMYNDLISKSNQVPLVDYLTPMVIFEGHDEFLGLIPRTILIQHYVSLRILLKQLVVHEFLVAALYYSFSF